MTKPALALGKSFRSEIEKEVAAQLAAEGIKYDYEGLVVRFTIPAFEARYNPDFPTHSGIIIETKGRFGHRGDKKAGAEVRHRLALVKEQHPELDIRIVFDKKRTAKLPIYKGSKTTQGQWATDHGFRWACERIPQAWIEEMKNVSDGTRASVDRKRPETASARQDRTAPPRKRKKHHAAGG